MRLAIAAPAVLAVLAGAAAAAPAPYDASVAASAAAEQSLFGPLDGAWRLAGPRGVGLYRFELADPAAEARQRADDGRISAYVEPVLVRAGDAESAVLKNYNMARYEGRNAGPIAMIGQGAGRYPTASAVLRDLSGIAQGEAAMFAPECVDGAADNSAAAHAYYVRLPKACADAFPVKDVLADEGGVLRIVTEAVSVQKMHECAAGLRKAGNAVFFAAVREA